jgi:hypothetical protein
LISRIRKALGGSSSDHSEGSHSAVPEAPVQQPLDILRDTARDICSDAWLANRMTLEIKTEGGKKTLAAAPAEAVPYVKAAYAIRKDELPSDVKGLFEGIAG